MEVKKVIFKEFGKAGIAFIYLAFFVSSVNAAQSRYYEPSWLDKNEVKRKVAENGYKNIKSIEAGPTGWIVRARHGKKNFYIYINPQSGDVTDQRKDTEDEEADIKVDSRESKCNPNTGQDCHSPISQLRDTCNIVTGSRCDPERSKNSERNKMH